MIGSRSMNACRSRGTSMRIMLFKALSRAKRKLTRQRCGNRRSLVRTSLQEATRYHMYTSWTELQSDIEALHQKFRRSLPQIIASHVLSLPARCRFRGPHNSLNKDRRLSGNDSGPLLVAPSSFFPLVCNKFRSEIVRGSGAPP